MTPKLTRPFIIQPVANGVMIFPAQEQLVFANAQIFESAWDASQYVQDLIKKGEPSNQKPLDNTTAMGDNSPLPEHSPGD